MPLSAVTLAPLAATARAGPVYRFAPSPTGHLHLGHVRSALLGHDMARAVGGRFLLRIEDIDRRRCRAEYTDAMSDVLAWLGITFEQPVLRQSQRFDIYGQMAHRLERAGLLYPCFATRTEIAAAASGDVDPDGAPLYPGLWRGADPARVAALKAAGEPFALRLDMAKAIAVAHERLAGRPRPDLPRTGPPRPGPPPASRPLTFTEVALDGTRRIIGAAPERWGDVVVVRKEFPASYHLAVVVDDACQGVTHVTRGLDLFSATDLHRLLQVLLDLPEPLYTHHALIVDAEGRKLAKRAGGRSIADMRAAGCAAADLVAMARLDLAPGFVRTMRTE